MDRNVYSAISQMPTKTDWYGSCGRVNVLIYRSLAPLTGS